MSLDVTGLGRLATQLEIAAGHAGAARTIDVPLLLGRGPARDAVRASLGEAADWASSATHESSGPADAIRAARELAEASTRLRAGSPRRVGADDALRGAAERSQAWAASIRHAIAADRPGDPRALATSLVDDIDALTVDPTRELTSAERLRLGHLLDIAAGADDVLPAPLLPGWSVNERGWTAARRTTNTLETYQHENVRAWIVGARGALDEQRPPEVLRQRLDELVDLPDEQLGPDELRELARMSMLPDGMRPALLPVTTSHARPFGTPLAPASITNSNVRYVVDDVRRKLAVDAVLADPAATRASMLDEAERILASPTSALGERDLRVLAALTSLPTELRPITPTLVHVDPAALHAARSRVSTDPALARSIDHLRLLVEGERLTNAPSARDALIERATATVAGDIAELSHEQVRDLALTSLLPTSVRPAWIDDELARGLQSMHVRGATGGRYEADTLRRARFLHLREQLLADHTLTPQRVDEELRALLATPDDAIRDDDLLRLSLLGSLPPHLRGALPDHALVEELPRAWATSYLRRRQPEMFERARLVELTTRQALDPANTPDAVTTRIAQLVANSNESLTTEQVRELAALTLLDPARRPAIDERSRIAWRHLSGEHPATSADLARDIERIRVDVDSARVALEAAHDPGGIAAEALRLVAEPAASLTNAQLRRLAVLERLPEATRPPVLAGTDRRLAALWLGEYSRNTLDETLRGLRVEAARSAEGAAAIRAIATDRSRPIDLRWLDQVRETHPQLVDAASVDARRELQARLDFVQAGAGSREQVRSTLERLPALLDELRVELPDPQALVRMRAELDELVQRNLDRMDGVRTDTYSRHPDYAEVGRIGAQARTLHQLDALAAPPATAQPLESGAAPDVLSW